MAKQWHNNFKIEDKSAKKFVSWKKERCTRVYLGVGVGTEERQHAMHFVHLARRRKAFHDCTYHIVFSQFHLVSAWWLGTYILIAYAEIWLMLILMLKYCGKKNTILWLKNSSAAFRKACQFWVLRSFPISRSTMSMFPMQTASCKAHYRIQ